MTYGFAIYSYITPSYKMGIVVPYLMGGLGNWLFQVAAAIMFAGKDVILSQVHCARSPHSPIDYFSTIFKKFPHGIVNLLLTKVEEPPKLHPFASPPSMRMHTLLFGYFQNWKTVPAGFRDMLDFENPSLLTKYPGIADSCFLHVRGGDYVGHWLHDVGLGKRYYPSAIQSMKDAGITRFSVFTNDRDYCLSQGVLKDLDYEFIDENEIDSLYLMSQCKAGIMANSSFSWWGAYLNPNRPICIPSKWFNDAEYMIDGYFFPGCYVHSV
jgi:hypothetical protein